MSVVLCALLIFTRIVNMSPIGQRYCEISDQNQKEKIVKTVKRKRKESKDVEENALFNRVCEDAQFPDTDFFPAENENLSVNICSLVAKKHCIDNENSFDQLILFPTIISTPIEKLATEENKENIPPSTDQEVFQPILKDVRQQNSHRCEEFGENLPDYLQMSHCQEHLFHFIGIKDTRTNYNTLIVAKK